MHTVLRTTLFVSAMLAGCIFGFFYTWSFVVMRGLSAAEAPVAIKAMQSVNATIMTPWFALIFFGTPIATAVAAFAAFAAGARLAALWMGAATAIYMIGCFAVTVLANIPMNDALAAVDAASVADAAGTWAGYARPWTAWNHVRTAACAGGLLCTLLALRALGGRGRDWTNGREPLVSRPARGGDK
jgi:uncharacterized membrane protein